MTKVACVRLRESNVKSSDQKVNTVRHLDLESLFRVTVGVFMLYTPNIWHFLKNFFSGIAE